MIIILIVGVILGYVFAAWIAAYIAQRVLENHYDKDFMAIVISIFWPLALFLWPILLFLSWAWSFTAPRKKSDWQNK